MAAPEGGVPSEVGVAVTTAVHRRHNVDDNLDIQGEPVAFVLQNGAEGVTGSDESAADLRKSVDKMRSSELLMESDDGSGVEEGDKFNVEAAAAALPPWRETLTFRALFTGAILGVAFCFISLKLSLTTGVIPSLNIAAGLLGYFCLASVTKITQKLGLTSRPFTAQENTVIQTCVVATYGMIYNGGFGTYLLAMDQQSYENVGDLPGNNPQDVVQPVFGRNIAFMYSIALFGVFLLVPLRRLFIIDFQLLFPSGTATAVMIQSFHSKSGAKAAKKQLWAMGKWFTFSFVFSGWKWVFTGNGDCGTNTGGFGSFPFFGIQAADATWLFDFSQNYVGVGMLCPQIVNWSIMFGAIISWGLMFPLLENREGDWYPAGLGGTDMRGIGGYKNMIAIAVFISDGAYIICKIIVIGLHAYRKRRQAAALAAAAAEGKTLPGAANNIDDLSENSKYAISRLAGETPQQRALRKYIFLTGAIPWWVGMAGYCCMLAIAAGVIPQLYSPVKWYYILVVGLLAPPLSFANAWGAGMTDWNVASLYGKLCIFIFAAWAGANGGGVIAGLAVCGVMMCSAASASDLMQDFRTGYLTMSSPRAMFVAQVIGALMGCAIAPACFALFWSAFDIGNPNSLYAAPYGTVYRGMAIIGVEGFGALPKHCTALMGGFFALAIVMNLCRDFLPKKYGKFVPLPMCMALPFFIGAWLAIDMCVGAVIMLIWRRLRPAKCELLSSAVASGLIAGDGIWTIPAAILAIAGVNPPICMGWSKASSG